MPPPQAQRLARLGRSSARQKREEKEQKGALSMLADRLTVKKEVVLKTKMDKALLQRLEATRRQYENTLSKLKVRH